jgi:hypothetical protein
VNFAGKLIANCAIISSNSSVMFTGEVNWGCSIKVTLKIAFVLLSYAWFYTSQVVLSDVSFGYLAMGLIIFSLGLHWIYAYIFNTDMHNHLGKIKPNESKATRFFSFIFAVGFVLYISYPANVRWGWFA